LSAILFNYHQFHPGPFGSAGLVGPQSLTRLCSGLTPGLASQALTASALLLLKVILYPGFPGLSAGPAFFSFLCGFSRSNFAPRFPENPRLKGKLPLKVIFFSFTYPGFDPINSYF